MKKTKLITKEIMYILKGTDFDIKTLLEIIKEVI